MDRRAFARELQGRVSHLSRPRENLDLTVDRMYFAYGAPHEKMAWEARREPAVIEIFEKLWETKELISSFDGMNISLPRRKDLHWSPWPHCDQNPDRKG